MDPEHDCFEGVLGGSSAGRREVGCPHIEEEAVFAADIGRLYTFRAWYEGRRRTRAMVQSRVGEAFRLGGVANAPESKSEQVTIATCPILGQIFFQTAQDSPYQRKIAHMLRDLETRRGVLR